MNYATLHQVRQYKTLAAAETADDALLTRFIRQSCRDVDRCCGRRFDARQETRLLDYPVPYRDAFGAYDAASWVAAMNAVADLNVKRLSLDDDLLTVTELLNGDGTEITAAQYVLEPANKYPKHAIRLVASSVNWLQASDGHREQIISVTGLWGYHPRYADAFVDSLDTVQDNPLTAAATSLTVSDADGLAGDGETTRFQAGNMIKIGDEFLDVLAVNTTSNVLTVVRGYNGTTAAEHIKTTKIYVYRPTENVVLAVTRLVAWRYAQKDADVFDKTAILGTGVKIIPSALPPDVAELLPSPRETL